MTVKEYSFPLKIRLNYNKFALVTVEFVVNLVLVGLSLSNPLAHLNQNS